MARLITIAVVLHLLGCMRPLRIVREASPAEDVLTVVTWNVNFGLASSPDAAAALEAATRGADLVLLQETNAEWEANVSTRMRARFPHQRWLDDAAAGGQAVLSARPFIVREVIAAPSRWFPALRIEAQTPLGTMQVLSVHLHPPIADDGSLVRGYLSTGPTRRSELEHFTNTLVAGLPTVIVGDFNEGTSGDALSWSARHGFRSALPEFEPRANTWHWPVSSSLELKAQFDHVLYASELEPLKAEVLNVGRSDHWPVRARLVLTATPRELPGPSGTSLHLSSSGASLQSPADVAH